ncbi:metallophosphoesterase [Candidatus Woesearchaeota archaeon]|nr:metallophosphoesterase [Candidatus Woesearchaeota archaeon]
MKAFCFTDLHGELGMLRSVGAKIRKEKPDIILCAGDISVFEHRMKAVLRRMNKWNVPVYIIHGNHESESSLKIACKVHSNISFIHQKVVVVDSYAIIGYGGGGFAERDKSFLKWLESAKGKFKRLEKIFVTHGPPFGTKLDKLGDYVGNKSYTAAIKRYKPVLYVCGHLHENEGKRDLIGGTIVLNPGPLGKFMII